MLYPPTEPNPTSCDANVWGNLDGGPSGSLLRFDGMEDVEVAFGAMSDEKETRRYNRGGVPIELPLPVPSSRLSEFLPIEERCWRDAGTVGFASALHTRS